MPLPYDLPDALLVLAALFLALVGGTLVGALLARLTGLGWLGAAIPLGALVSLSLALPLALRTYGEHATGTVIERRERVAWRPDRERGHEYLLTVQYLPRHPERADPMLRRPGTDSLTLIFPADAATFDRAAVGSTVEVVYLPDRPSPVRLADQASWSLVGEILGDPSNRPWMAALSAVLVVVALVRWRPRTRRAGRARLAAGAACGLVIASTPLCDALGPLLAASDRPALPAAAAPEAGRVLRS